MIKFPSVFYWVFHFFSYQEDPHGGSKVMTKSRAHHESGCFEVAALEQTPFLFFRSKVRDVNVRKQPQEQL